jgi:hypothetical protein
VDKNTGRLARALLGGDTQRSYLDSLSLNVIVNKGKETAKHLCELQSHPLNIIFSLICSEEGLGLDIRMILDYDHFVGIVSVSFLARILFSVIRTGILRQY